MTHVNWFKTWDEVMRELAERSMRDGRPLSVDEMMVAWDRDCPDVAVVGVWMDWTRAMVHGCMPDGRLQFFDWCEGHACWEPERCAPRGGSGNPE